LVWSRGLPVEAPSSPVDDAASRWIHVVFSVRSSKGSSCQSFRPVSNIKTSFREFSRLGLPWRGTKTCDHIHGPSILVAVWRRTRSPRRSAKTVRAFVERWAPLHSSSLSQRCSSSSSPNSPLWQRRCAAARQPSVHLGCLAPTKSSRLHRTIGVGTYEERPQQELPLDGYPS